jgi:hypothetical protein
MIKLFISVVNSERSREAMILSSSADAERLYLPFGLLTIITKGQRVNVEVSKI